MAGLRSLLPDAVEVEEATSDRPGDAMPGEDEDLRDAVPRRRAEFATARGCARRALARLGLSSAAIPVGPRREPVWPAGVVGSITHCEGYRAAAVARAEDVLTLGIDAEPHQPLPGGVHDLVTVGDEPRMLSRLANVRPEVAWDRLLFSAKESIYKAWFPLTGAWLDFTECELTIDPASGTFVGRLRVAGPIVGDRALDRFRGRWTIREDRILCATWEPACA